MKGTDARLIVTIDEAKVSAGAIRDIRTAYLQLAFVDIRADRRADRGGKDHYSAYQDDAA